MHFKFQNKKTRQKMPTAKIKLSDYGGFLSDHLKTERNCFEHCDLVIRCKDGDVKLHKVILAGQTASPSILRALKTNLEDETTVILLPDIAKQSVNHLKDLLYSGESYGVSDNEISDLKVVSELLKINSLSLNVFENEEFESTSCSPEGKLSIEIIERKRPIKGPKVQVKSEVEEEEETSIRRSKRAKIKNKKLDDFETPLKGSLIGNVADIKEENESQQEPKTREMTIINTLIRVSEPKEEAMEVKTQTSLPQEIVRMCLICGKRLIGKHAFSRHLKQKHGHGSFTCQFCDEAFDSGFKLHEHARLKKHNELQLGSKTYKKVNYKCDINDCQADFITFNSFQKHCLTAHNLFPLECKICKKRYKEQATFKNHMETHQGVLKYECDVCSKKFVTRERLFAHRRLHLGKRYICSQCDFKARSSTALRNHIVMKHKERRFQCFLCSKKFASKQNLEQHSVVHTGRTSWHCSPCDMSFKRHHHFKAHLSSQAHKAKAGNEGLKREILDGMEGHSSIRCDVCGMMFKFDFHLKQHLKSKAHLNKVNEKLNRGETVPDHLIGTDHDFSLVIPLNLEPSFVEQPLVDSRTKFNDDDLINLADNNSELLLDDSNVQLIIVNEANQDVMLMTSNEVKLSDAASEDHSLMM